LEKLPYYFNSVHQKFRNKALMSFQFRNVQFSARSRKSRNYAEEYIEYAAQVIPPIDAEIADKGHFWMETEYYDETLPISSNKVWLHSSIKAPAQRS